MCLKPIVAAVAAILLVANLATAQTALDRLESTLRSKPAPAAVAQPYLGFVPNETIEDGKGVHVEAVSKGGPAELGGLKGGDLITAIDGKPVRNLTDFDAIYGSAKVGQKLSVTIERAAKVQKLTITLAARPAAATAASDEPGEAPAADPSLLEPAAAAPSLTPPATTPPLSLTEPAAPASSPPLDPLASPDSLRGPRSAPIRSRPATDAPLELGAAPADPSAAPAGLDPLPAPETTPLPADGLAVPAAKPSLGIKVVELTDQARAVYNLSVRRGALITYIRPGSPADTVGLPIGGVVVALDGRRIDTADQLVSAIGARTVGTEIELTYYDGPDLARKSVRLAPAPTALVTDPGTDPSGGLPAPGATTPAPLDLKLGGSGRPLLNKVEQLVEGITSPRTAPGAIPRGPSTVYDPSEMAALRSHVLELEEKVTALEERIKLLESKLGAEAPAANPVP